MKERIKSLLNQKWVWAIIGAIILLLVVVGVSYACAPKECYEDCEITPVPEISVTPEITATPTPEECIGDCQVVTPTPVEPTGIPNVPAPSQPSDGKSDGRSSCPECTKTPEPIISLPPCTPSNCGWK